MRYLNLTTLSSIILEFANRHSQVNSAYVLNEIDYRAIPNVDYPATFITPVEANIDANNFISQGFVITVADIMNTAFVGENNFRLIDGCQRIAGDITTYLQNQIDFEASTLITYNSFEDEGTDRTAGVVFRINLIYLKDDATCILDDIVDLTRGFSINLSSRTVTFKSWLMYPYVDMYEVTFDGGENWLPMTQYTYGLGTQEYPVQSIGQRLKQQIVPTIVWNNEVIPEDDGE